MWSWRYMWSLGATLYLYIFLKQIFHMVEFNMDTVGVCVCMIYSRFNLLWLHEQLLFLKE